MIKVLIILIVLVLSGIFAYLTLSKNKGSPTPTVVPGPSSESQESGKEDEDTSSTATAQPIETEPPEPEVEDKGTCETTGDWAMSDECNADGTAIFTQTYKESKPGACPTHEKASVKKCCYQKGDWKDISQCKSTGKKTQEQTTVNCLDIMKTREVDCEYIGPWQKSGVCSSEGKQDYYRITVNSTAPTSKVEDCCYVGEWGNFNRIQGNFFKVNNEIILKDCTCGGGSLPCYYRTRDVKNCPSDVKSYEQKAKRGVNCRQAGPMTVCDSYEMC